MQQQPTKNRKTNPVVIEKCPKAVRSVAADNGLQLPCEQGRVALRSYMELSLDFGDDGIFEGSPGERRTVGNAKCGAGYPYILRTSGRGINNTGAFFPLSLTATSAAL